MVAHNVVRINGTLPGGEVWSVNPKYNSPAGPITDYDELLAWAENFAESITEWTSAFPLRQLLSTAAAITSVRMEYRQADDTLGQAAEYIFPTPFAGTGAANKIFQSSVVCSILTGRPGRSYRGRIYWPALNAGLDTQLRLTEATRNGIVAAFFNLFQEVTTAAFPIQPDMTLRVVSQTLDVSTPATLIQVGDILDIQRRRRDSLQEFYSSYPMTPEP